jgi:hypothetical protein
MKKFRVILKVLSLCLAILLGLAAGVQADSVSVYEGTSLTDVSLFGDLSQQNSIITAKYGNYGCQVTAYANALVYLQKTYPSIYGTSLVSDYSGDTLARTAVALGASNYINVQVTTSNGDITGAFSRFRDQVWGVYNYIEDQAPRRTVYGAQVVPVPDMDQYGNPPGGWTYPRLKPDWVSKGNAYPTEVFLQNALSNSQGLVICWNEISNGQLNMSGASHLLTVTGLTWDSINKKGTLYFIDPSVGKQLNSPFRQVNDGSLWLDYGEYAPGSPWKKSNGENWWYSGDARITLALAEGPVPTPLPGTLLLLGSGLLGLAGWRRFRKG